MWVTVPLQKLHVMDDTALLEPFVLSTIIKAGHVDIGADFTRHDAVLVCVSTRCFMMWAC